VSGILRLRKAALITTGVLVAAASLVSFAESYRGLLLWASHHGLHGVWAVAWPLQVDVFIAVGELALFVALADRSPVRSRVAAWGVTVLGLAASVAGNVGHITGSDLASRVTAAVPPLAAAAALTVGLGVLKRVVATAPAEPDPEVPGAQLAALNGHAHQAAELFAAELGRGDVPPIRRIRSEMHVGQPRAQAIAEYLRSLTRT
jgi:hypothetical protein